MRRMLMLEEKSHGQDPELTELSKALFEKVIPRMMRPLETGGRTIEPCLVHSDIWLGNVKPDAETEEPIIFDSCAFWGHNEGSSSSRSVMYESASVQNGRALGLLLEI
ncbi:hypothetical protein VF21_07029 [Pseudogymnoascus sp. 05NY08]|nr:hypothetical protein VF21_07029 [Pseudogymnoascus sp. 05NY08]